MLKKLFTKLFKPSPESTKTDSKKHPEVENVHKPANRVRRNRSAAESDQQDRGGRYSRSNNRKPRRNRDRFKNREQSQKEEPTEVKEFVEPSYPPDFSDHLERRPRSQSTRPPRRGGRPTSQESRASKYAQRRRSEGAEYRKQDQAPPPIPSPPEQSVFNSDKFFKDMGLTETLSSILASKGFVHPSKAQSKTLSIILEGKNLICSSETGSGKTLAFSIPVLEQLINKKIDQACILTPTREIAIQIESVIKPIAEELNITTGLAIGGLDMLVQKNILRKYPQILIATPGRLVDVLTQGLVWLDYTQVVVLDEVDRMLDMGFEKEITTLFENFPSSAQILMFTATMNKELEKLSQKYVKNYELVKIGETMKTKNSIEHLFLSISPREKYDILKKTLLRKKHEKVLVFCNSIDDTSGIFRKLKKDRLQKIECLHSKKSQTERNHVLDGFRSERINHLLTTDVLARGIDIPNIGAVINYELPYDPEDYVHRIGRTGRADFTGKALSFVDAKSELKLKKIKQLIKSDSGFNFIHREALETF